jgi:hypothetical protein
MYILDIHLDGIIFLRRHIKVQIIHLLKRGDQIIYVFEDLKEAIQKAMAEQLSIVRLRVNEDGTTRPMVIYEPQLERR